MVEQAAPNARAFTETPGGKNPEIGRTNFVRTWKNRPKFTATKQMLNLEKGNLKTVGKLCGTFTCRCPIPFPSWVALLKTAASMGPWPLVLEGAVQTFFTDYFFLCSNLSGSCLKD